mmetsp:Transcript_40198/g.60909  ORF Transcript_40198/g.60909 Transcript_40198/m.60909 type:complete len:617 (-) Transcript_40198:177-2027(-)
MNANQKSHHYQLRSHAKNSENEMTSLILSNYNVKELHDDNNKNENRMDEVKHEQIVMLDAKSGIDTSEIREKNESDFGEQLSVWVQNASAVLSTVEYQNLTSSTLDIVTTASNTIIPIATLPFTLPLHMTQWACSGIVHIVRLPLQPFYNENNNLPSSPKTITDSGDSSFEPRHYNNPIHEFLDGAVVPILCHTVQHVQHHVGSTFFHILHGIFPKEHDEKQTDAKNVIECSAGQSSAEDETRCHIGVVTPPLKEQQPQQQPREVPVDNARYEKKKPTVTITAQTHEQYSIRTSDLNITSKEYSKVTSLSYNPQQPNIMFLNTMNALVQQALFLATTSTSSSSFHILPVDWKPEGSTKKWLRQQHSNKHNTTTDPSWIKLLEEQVLIYSGKIQTNPNHPFVSSSFQKNDNTTIYKACGIIPNTTPLSLLELLLDSNRVGEYNAYSLGRTDEVVFHDFINNDDDEDVVTASNSDDETIPLFCGKGTTKIVCSETKIPFTNQKVFLRNITHARKLVVPNAERSTKQENDNGTKDATNNYNSNGYIIVSRSITSPLQKKQQNEIVWGINVLQSIPNYPNKTILTSVSQVKSNMVPGFMAHQIGMMGVVDFFKNVRKVVV